MILCIVPRVRRPETRTKCLVQRADGKVSPIEFWHVCPSTSSSWLIGSRPLPPPGARCLHHLHPPHLLSNHSRSLYTKHSLLFSRLRTVDNQIAIFPSSGLGVSLTANPPSPERHNLIPNTPPSRRLTSMGVGRAKRSVVGTPFGGPRPPITPLSMNDLTQPHMKDVKQPPPQLTIIVLYFLMKDTTSFRHHGQYIPTETNTLDAEVAIRTGKPRPHPSHAL